MVIEVVEIGKMRSVLRTSIANIFCSTQEWSEYRCGGLRDAAHLMQFPPHDELGCGYPPQVLYLSLGVFFFERAFRISQENGFGLEAKRS